MDDVVVQMLSAYASKLRTQYPFVERDEILSIMVLGVLPKLAKHDPARGSLHGYVCMVGHRAFIDYLRKHGRLSRTCQQAAVEDYDPPSVEDPIAELIAEEEFNYLMDHLTGKELEVMRVHVYKLGWNGQRLKWGRSKGWMSQTYHKALNKLRNIKGIEAAL